MKKLAIVLAALAVIGVALSPLVSPVQAQSNKKLWQGFMEELQKVGQPAAPAKK
jgi:hypothetical protein